MVLKKIDIDISEDPTLVDELIVRFIFIEKGHEKIFGGLFKKGDSLKSVKRELLRVASGMAEHETT